MKGCNANIFIPFCCAHFSSTTLHHPFCLYVCPPISCWLLLPAERSYKEGSKYFGVSSNKVSSLWWTTSSLQSDSDESSLVYKIFYTIHITMQSCVVLELTPLCMSNLESVYCVMNRVEAKSIRLDCRHNISNFLAKTCMLTFLHHYTCCYKLESRFLVVR